MLGSLKLNFAGWAVGIDDIFVTDVSTGNLVDTEEMSVVDVVSKIKSGKWSISLSECLKYCRKSEVEIFDVEVDE